MSEDSRRRTIESLHGQHGDVTTLDLTSKGTEPWVRFSPFYPHGGILVPFSDGVTGYSVEGIWQALKVFEREDVDPSKLSLTRMEGIKRGAGQRRGKVLGHRNGLRGSELLGYAQARRAIYLPSYRWILEHRVQTLVADLRGLGAKGLVVLWDYETNGDIDDLTSPLSHAALVRHYLEGTWPT